MRIKLHWLAVLLCALVGCSSLQVAPPLAANIWLDSAFDYQPGLVTIDQETLFQLDSTLLATLHGAGIQKASVEERVRYMLALILGPTGQRFAYQGRSTVAAQTWELHTGDCLSLTVLAYAMAKELRLKASMQEVPVPVTIDRRGGVDYQVGHVNLYIGADTIADRTVIYTPARGIIVDFEPVMGAARVGAALEPPGMLARYYNNLGAQFLAEGDWSRAYAHFRSAIQADYEFLPARVNLALLYHRSGHAAHAEQVLSQVVERRDQSMSAVRALRELLLEQGRIEEAEKFAQLLMQRQEQDPYYWIGVGLNQFKLANYKECIDALEHAQSLTTGFAELHRALAVAYMKQGQRTKAEQQIATLANIDRDDPSLLALSTKLKHL